MSVITKSQLNSFQAIDFDLAHDEGVNLLNGIRTDIDGTTIYSGTHPEHGNIHIIVPPFGSGILLFPFETRALE